MMRCDYLEQMGKMTCFVEERNFIMDFNMERQRGREICFKMNYIELFAAHERLDSGKGNDSHPQLHVHNCIDQFQQHQYDTMTWLRQPVK